VKLTGRGRREGNRNRREEKGRRRREGGEKACSYFPQEGKFARTSRKVQQLVGNLTRGRSNGEKDDG
jgi:hypothetical protein